MSTPTATSDIAPTLSLSFRAQQRTRLAPSPARMRIPIELVERIIDASSANRPTLAACSLVCKHWLPRSRHHLFSSLDLSADWNPEPNAVTEFFELIDAPNSTLVPYVAGVVLSKRSWGMTPVHKLLAGLACSGIRPRSLHINCPTYEPAHLPIFTSSLAHLALYLHTDIPMSTLIDHVCGFPLLESLYIGGSARYSATVRPLSQEPPPKLRALIISDPVFADWLLSLDPIPKQISTIVLRDIKLPHQWLAINEYLTSTAGMAIRSLTFHDCDSQEQYTPPALHRLEDVLDALHRSPACATLETVDICATNQYGLRTNVQSHWRKLDAILADVRVYPRLRRVTVRIRTRSLENPDSPVDYAIPKGLASQLHQDMPLFYERGILLAF
ncbi:hypothetical protein DFH06DRAFT_1434513 [Mycena polygramma]|nr:hypothetical protein DFH06DRAFT_1434513 [Mycena polygramma]